MHCRFLNEDLLPNIEINKKATMSVLQAKIQHALSFKDKTVIELPSSKKTTKKFSVMTEDDPVTFVHLTYNI